MRVGRDGVQALQLARERRPDIIVSDIEMPNMTGHELCRAIKNDPVLCQVPLILFVDAVRATDIIRDWIAVLITMSPNLIVLSI